MIKIATAAFVFTGGFTVMTLEIIGPLYLAKTFGSSFYVWTSQIGVVLTALALGYAIGGALADRFQRTAYLALPLGLAGVFVFFIPTTTPRLLDAILMRHPAGVEIPALWRRLDPAMGSALVFFLPCFVLAVISPYMVAIASRRLDRVGTTSGLIYAASTVGSIAGVFVTGYVFIDNLHVTTIFRVTGVLTLVLAGMSVAMDFWMGAGRRAAAMETVNQK